MILRGSFSFLRERKVWGDIVKHPASPLVVFIIIIISSTLFCVLHVLPYSASTETPGSPSFLSLRCVCPEPPRCPLGRPCLPVALHYILLLLSAGGGGTYRYYTPTLPRGLAYQPSPHLLRCTLSLEACPRCLLPTPYLQYRVALRYGACPPR